MWRLSRVLTGRRISHRRSVSRSEKQQNTLANQIFNRMMCLGNVIALCHISDAHTEASVSHNHWHQTPAQRLPSATANWLTAGPAAAGGQEGSRLSSLVVGPAMTRAPGKQWFHRRRQKPTGPACRWLITDWQLIDVRGGRISASDWSASSRTEQSNRVFTFS